MTKDSKTFEDNMHRLDQIVRMMERGDISIDESLKLFQEGTQLVETCGKILDDVPNFRLKKSLHQATGALWRLTSKMNLEFNNLTDEYKKCIERYLDNECFCNYNNEPQSLLFDAMRYSLLAGGKRLRPIFVFDFCRMCCSEWERALPFAAAVEMIHTYSLIHDDLPCMDNDDYRRGRLTNHKVYGEAIAVLSGDALLTAAFKYIASASFSADVRIQAVDIIAECAGEIGMVGGQVLDMQAEQTDCTEQNVLAIQSRKTGALIRAACMLGVLAGNGTPEQLSAASEFAYYIGLAFQIRDDILDVIGSVEDLGKSVASDKNKATFVQLYGIDKCVALVHSLTDKALKSLNVFHDNKYMSYLALQLTERNI